MVVLFDEKDLLSFGKFMISTERQDMHTKIKEEYPNIETSLEEVSNVDIDLWISINGQ